MPTRPSRRAAAPATHPAFDARCKRCTFHGHPCREHLEAALRRALRELKAAQAELARVKGGAR